MAKEVNLPEFLSRFLKHLRLRWDLLVYEEEENESSLLSDAKLTTHSLYADQAWLQKPREYLSGWVHKLCHAALAERLSPAFSGIHFSEKHSTTERLSASEINTFRACWNLVDLWVDDLMATLNSRLNIQSLRLFYNSLNDFVVRQDFVKLSLYRTVFGLAMAIAECERHGFDPAPFRDFAAIYQPQTELGQLIEAMYKLYQSLGQLSFDKEKDLKTLEAAVQQVAGIIQFKRWPRLVEENRGLVWLLEKI